MRPIYVRNYADVAVIPEVNPVNTSAALFRLYSKQPSLGISKVRFPLGRKKFTRNFTRRSFNFVNHLCILKYSMRREQMPVDTKLNLKTFGAFQANRKQTNLAPVPRLRKPQSLRVFTPRKWEMFAKNTSLIVLSERSPARLQYVNSAVPNPEPINKLVHTNCCIICGRLVAPPLSPQSPYNMTSGPLSRIFTTL